MNESIVSELDLGINDYGEKLSGLKEDFWGDLKRETKVSLRKLMETTMQYQVNDLIGSGRWQHNYDRPTYRNGNYVRSLLSTYGYIENIRVPRLREGRINSNIFKKYQRRVGDVDGLILEMFLAGVSTRRVEEVLRPLLDKGSVSAGLVSKVTEQEQRKRQRDRTLKIYIALSLKSWYNSNIR